MTTCEIDLDSSEFKIPGKDVKTVLELDIIEHLKSPENFLARLRTSFGDSDARIVLTTANIGFITMRLALLLGSFNYGKRGILDLDHKRLFTFSSLEKLLNAQGFQIEKIEGIPAPFPIALGNNFLSRLLLSINQMLIILFRSLFAYQIAFVVRAKPTLDSPA